MIKHIEISEDLHRRIKVASSERGIFMREFLALLVTDYEREQLDKKIGVQK